MNDFETARINMVNGQIRPNGITDHRIIAAMNDIAREAFVPDAHRMVAYIDENLPLADAGEEEAIRYLMAPMSFARLLQLADISANDLVLDVGCATGYSTAVIARLAQSVIALEADGNLARKAGQLLAGQGIMNAVVVTGPPDQGYKPESPYDVIVVNGAVAEVPLALLDQLAEGGRLVVVIRPKDGIGKITLYTRDRSAISSRQAYDANVPRIMDNESQEARFVF